MMFRDVVSIRLNKSIIKLVLVYSIRNYTSVLLWFGQKYMYSYISRTFHVNLVEINAVVIVEICIFNQIVLT